MFKIILCVIFSLPPYSLAFPSSSKARTDAYRVIVASAVQQSVPLQLTYIDAMLDFFNIIPTSQTVEADFPNFCL